MARPTCTTRGTCMLLKQPLSRSTTHGVRVAWGGGCPREIWQAFEERFGVEIHECYGMTEASSITTWNERRVLGSVGRPVPWLRVELVTPQGQPVPTGERGEIVVHAGVPGAITRGYFNSPDATAKALRSGALHTRHRLVRLPGVTSISMAARPTTCA